VFTCICHAVTGAQDRGAVDEGAHTLIAVSDAPGRGLGMWNLPRSHRRH